MDRKIGRTIDIRSRSVYTCTNFPPRLRSRVTPSPDGDLFLKDLPLMKQVNTARWLTSPHPLAGKLVCLPNRLLGRRAKKWMLEVA